MTRGDVRPVNRAIPTIAICGFLATTVICVFGVFQPVQWNTDARFLTYPEPTQPVGAFWMQDGSIRVQYCFMPSGKASQFWLDNWSLLGMGVSRRSGAPTCYQLYCPQWSPPVLLALLVGLRWNQRLRRARDQMVEGSCCRRCQYLLRGNTSGVCPECGTPVHEIAPIEARTRNGTTQATEAAGKTSRGRW